MLSILESLLSHAGFIRYFKNTSWAMGEQFLRIIAGLLVGTWVARYLGPEQFGLFSYALAFTAIFGGIAKLGLDGIIVRELVNNPEKRDTYLGTAFWLKTLGVFLMMGILVAIVPFTSNGATTNLFIFIIAAGMVFQSFEVVEFYFQSQVLAKIVSICKVIQLALSSMIKIYLVLTEAELIYFVLVTAFDALSLAVSYAIAYKLRKNPAFYKHFDFSIAKQLLKDSWPLIFSAIVVMIYMRIDQIMIKEVLGEYEVGIYSAAVKLSEAWYFLPTLITASLFPAILNAKKISEDLYYERLQNLYSFMVLIALAVAIPTIFISDWVIALLYGVAYEGAGAVLIIHIWAGVFVGLGIARKGWVIAENLQFYSMLYLAIGLLLNVLGNLILIPIYGIEGAALATLFSQFMVAIMLPGIFKKTRRLFFMMVNALLHIKNLKRWLYMQKNVVKDLVKKIVFGSSFFYWLYRKFYLRKIDELETITLNQLIALEGKDKKELGDISQVKLNEILEYARAKVPFYKDLIKDDSYSSFKALPIMDKKLIRENLNLLISDDYKLDELGLRNTGGSTGEPFEFYSDKQAGAYNNAHHWYLYRLMGRSHSDIIVGCGGLSIPEKSRCKNIFWIKNPPGYVFGDYAFSALYLDDTNIKIYIDKLLSLRPVILRGYPSFFDRLAVHILTNDISIDFKIKGVSLTAEMCSEQQRKNIEKAFSTRVFFEYGHTEISMYCFTKDESYTYYSSPIYGYMEILDEGGNDVQPGEVGRVIVTGFNNRGMPFIRYDTGDLARLRYRSYGFVLLDDIAGRTQDFLWTKDMQKVYLTALIFGQHLMAFKNIIKWQLVQNEPGKVILKIHKGPNYTESDQDEIMNNFKNVADFDMSFEYTSDLYSTVSGKHMFLVQNCKST